jgi:hypothetical protein
MSWHALPQAPLACFAVLLIRRTATSFPGQTASTDLLQELCWRQHSADPEVVPAQPEGTLHKRIISLGLQLHMHNRCSRYGRCTIRRTADVALGAQPMLQAWQVQEARHMQQ